MIRVYFDWNVCTEMAQKTRKLYADIHDLIASNRTSILAPYSPAHLQDLKRSYFKSERGKTLTEKDLDFLSELTENHCLCYDFQDKSVYPNNIHPFKYFEEIFIKQQGEDLFDFENIFSKDDPLGKVWQSYMKLLRAMPTGIDLSELQKFPSLNGLLNSTTQNNNLGSLMDDLIRLFKNPKDFEKIFKAVREDTSKSLKTNTDSETWGDPYKYLDELFRNNKLGQTFKELTEKTSNNYSKKPSRFDTFTNHYIQLDMFGFHKDKRIENLMDDAAHCFYGAHCDIFITDDHNTNRKAQALYDYLNIQTEVVYASEFLAALRKIKLFEEEGPILEQIEYLVQNAMLLMDTVDGHLNPSKVHMIKPVLKNYFDRMQISDYGNSTSLIFYKKRTNYSDFFFWKEFESVVNNLVGEFGADDNSKSKFLQNEKDSVLDHTWTGRTWRKERADFTLKHNEDPFSLTFSIDMKYLN